MKKEQVSEFDQYAENYMEVLSSAVKLSGGKGDYFNWYKVAEVAKHEDQKELLQILDFGCGEGNMEFHFKIIFPSSRIVGIDTSAKSIEVANQKEIEGVEYKNFDGANLPFENNLFDIVFTSMVFHHIKPDEHLRYIMEIYRVLKPGGRFYLFEHNPRNIATHKIVEKCVFDKDAILVHSKVMVEKLRMGYFENFETIFTLFFPRNGIFKILHPLEEKLKNVPFGAQYYIKSLKPL
jgi:ubiquinone/menaquinone biosynthesis C-methylase UbiE